MNLGNLHVADILVIAAYFVVVVILGRKAALAVKGQEGLFLAGRKLGKFYQFFLNFGQATDSSGAVSVSSLVYQQGVSGVWLQFQSVFMNPYYWFLFVWYRRTRLVTMAELFEDRFGSRKLGKLYAIWQIGMAIAFIGFGNLLSYKMMASIWTKPESSYSAAERTRVDNYHTWRKLEENAAQLEGRDRSRLEELRVLAAKGELASEISPLKPFPFYCVASALVAIYVVCGGMAAIAYNEALQGILIVVFSVLLIPFGLREIGGSHGLHEHVPADFFHLFGTGTESAYSFLAMLAILFVSLVQIHANMGHMGIAGAARTEFAARFGVAGGTYAKRLVIILWAFAGLIAVAIYRGPRMVSDPDEIWGIMSRELLPAGLLGLMVAGILAAKMSVLSNQAVAMSALFVRNLYRSADSPASDREAVLVGRIAMVAVLALGVGAAFLMGSLTAALKMLLIINVPFGAAIAMIFWWRRLTATAVWTSVLLSGLLMLVVPAMIPAIPGLRAHPSLTLQAKAPVPNAARPALYFDTLVLSPSADGLPDRYEGRGRFNVEIFLLKHLGFDVGSLHRSGLLAAQFFFDGVFPFAVLWIVSLVTSPTHPGRVAHFYGKLKTPVTGTPDEDGTAMIQTLQQPDRFDHLKLWPRSNWEFTRWNRVDAVGFSACCGVSVAILGGFWLILRCVS